MIHRGRPVRFALLSLLLCGGGAGTLRAVTCTVPTASHPTVGAAMRDLFCTTIELAAGAYPENVVLGRDVAIVGAGSGTTAIEGRVAVTGETTDVAVDALTVDGTAAGVAGCWSEILAVGGGAALVSGADLHVLQTATGGGTCRIFADAFESGGVLAWSSSVP